MGLDIYHVKLTENTKDNLDYFSIEEFENNSHFLETHRHLLISNDAQSPIIYYEKKGYQRKQVTSSFINHFENEKLYFDIATVKKAKFFLKALSKEEQQALEQSFQENFIDNFVEGESIFFVSW